MGFDGAGFDCAFQCEIDKTANDVLARHWPKVPRFKDVRDCHSRLIGNGVVKSVAEWIAKRLARMG